MGEPIIEQGREAALCVHDGTQWVKALSDASGQLKVVVEGNKHVAGKLEHFLIFHNFDAELPLAAGEETTHWTVTTVDTWVWGVLFRVENSTKVPVIRIRVYDINDNLIFNSLHSDTPIVHWGYNAGDRPIAGWDIRVRDATNYVLKGIYEFREPLFVPGGAKVAIYAEGALEQYCRVWVWGGR